MTYPTPSDSDNSNTSLDLLVREDATRDANVPSGGPQLETSHFKQRCYFTRQQKYLIWIVITLAFGSLLWGFKGHLQWKSYLYFLLHKYVYLFMQCTKNNFL